MDIVKEILIGFFTSFFAGILMNIERKRLILVGFAGVITWMTYYFVNTSHKNAVLATFIAAIALGIVSEIMAVSFKFPATLVASTAFVTLVPGYGAYKTVKYFVDNDINAGITSLVFVIACGGSVAFGILLSTHIFRKIRFGIKKLNYRNVNGQ